VTDDWHCSTQMARSAIEHEHDNDDAIAPQATYFVCLWLPPIELELELVLESNFAFPNRGDIIRSWAVEPGRRRCRVPRR
jgi:hypothetical protein